MAIGALRAITTGTDFRYLVVAVVSLVAVAAAFVVDSIFQGAAFCKYVCPIGQFNFVQSLVSPWEVRIRTPAVCHTCTTKDCIRGRAGIPGRVDRAERAQDELSKETSGR